MNTAAVHWYILAGGLSPYTLALWERVASRSNHEVTLAYVPRAPRADFAHESEVFDSQRVELVPVESLGTAVHLGLRSSKEPHAAVVCMGYSPLYNFLISAFLRAAGRDKRLLLYMSDTNGVALAERAGASLMDWAALIAKRLALGSTFGSSLDLGFTNSLAHRLQGIRAGIDIPLLGIDFPTSMEPEVPEPLASLVRELPSPRLLAVARLVEDKNLVALVEAFSNATQDGMLGSLTIVGDGPLRAQIEPLVRKTSGRMLLAGAVPFAESRRLFGAFDGMVQPSVIEPWGIAIIEGLGWGIPVLSSRQCGAGVSLAFETGDAVKLCGTSKEDLHANLLSFVKDLERHTKAAKACAPLVQSKYAMVGVADALIRLATQVQESR